MVACSFTAVCWQKLRTIPLREIECAQQPLCHDSCDSLTFIYRLLIRSCLVSTGGALAAASLKTSRSPTPKKKKTPTTTRRVHQNIERMVSSNSSHLRLLSSYTPPYLETLYAACGCAVLACVRASYLHNLLNTKLEVCGAVFDILRVTVVGAR